MDKTKILVIEVVEDESSMRNILKEELTEEGFKVLEALDGEEGLEIAKREHPDLILLDLKMPKMDGVEMLQKLREDEWGSTAKVIVLTVFKENEKIAEVLESGGYDYITKNGGVENVIQSVKEKLGKE